MRSGRLGRASSVKICESQEREREREREKGRGREREANYYGRSLPEPITLGDYGAKVTGCSDGVVAIRVGLHEWGGGLSESLSTCMCVCLRYTGEKNGRRVGIYTCIYISGKTILLLQRVWGD